MNSVESLQTWLGGMPLSSFRVVYIFDGEASADTADALPNVADYGYGCALWRQRHNPFLGRDAPPTFSQGWKAWHELMFDEKNTRETENASQIMYITSNEGTGNVGAACVIERDFSTASAYLRTMAMELQLSADDLFEGGFKRDEFSLHGFRNSAEQGFTQSSAAHEYAAFLIKIPPNAYSPAVPFTCCDGHRVISYLCAKARTLKTEAELAQYVPEFFRPLEDLSLSCTHLAYKEIELGWVYKQALCSAGLRHLSGAVKRMWNKPSRLGSPGALLKLEYHRLELPFLFSTVDRATVRDFFTTPILVSRLGRAWCQWFRAPCADAARPAAVCWKNRAHTVRATLLGIVPYDLQGRMPRDLLGSMCWYGTAPTVGSSLYVTTLQACRAVHITRSRRAVFHVVRSRVGPEHIARIVCEFVGLDIFESEEDLLGECSFRGWQQFNAGEFSGVGQLFISNLKMMQNSNLVTARDPVLTRGVVELAGLLQADTDQPSAQTLVTFCARLLEAGANPFAIFSDLGISVSVSVTDDDDDDEHEHIFCMLCFILHRWARTSRVFFGIQEERRAAFRQALQNRAVLRHAEPKRFTRSDKTYRLAVRKVAGVTISLENVEEYLAQALDVTRALGYNTCRKRLKIF